MDTMNPLGSQVVIMTREDLDYTIHKTVQVALEDWRNAQPQPLQKVYVEESGERFLTREETSQMLHVDYSTLWRWNRDGLLCTVKCGPRRVMYRYADVIAVLGGKHKHCL